MPYRTKSLVLAALGLLEACGSSPSSDGGIDASADAPISFDVSLSLDVARVDASRPDVSPVEASADGGADATIQDATSSDDVVQPPPFDAGLMDATLPQPEASTDAAAHEASSSSDAGAPSTVVVVGESATGKVLAHVFSKGSSGHFAWGAATSFATSGASIGGVAVLPSGEALATLVETNSSQDSSAVSESRSSSSWASGDGLDTSGADEGTVGSMGHPVVTTSGAAVAYLVENVVNNEVFGLATVVCELNASTSTWNTQSPAKLLGSGTRGAPAIAFTDDGSALLVGGGGPGTGASAYLWAERTGTTWGAPAQVAATTTSGQSEGMEVQLAKRVGADSIVGAFLTGSNAGALSLQSATFSAGAWSTPINLTSNVDLAGGASSLFSLSALPDGRVALAYSSSSSGGGLYVGFWDGTAWSSFRAPTSIVSSAVAVAPGAEGAVLELAFVDSQGELMHTRLTNEASWSWTTPALVDASTQFVTVALAEGP